MLCCVVLCCIVLYCIVCVIKNNLIHSLTSVYFVNQPLHLSGIFVAHRQEVYYIYIYIYIYIYSTYTNLVRVLLFS